MTIESTVDHLFRRSAGQMVAALTRSLGAQHLDLAEEAVQDALVRALEVWRFNGVPEDPRAWLFRVARNRAVDLLRRDATFTRKLEQLGGAERLTHGISDAVDDELAMLFMCCHPALSRDAQITLTLKTVGAFSVPEIAAAFLSEPATIAQRIVRAKRTLQERRVEFEIPEGDAIVERLPVVLDVLFLMFNEGYASHSGDRLVRVELCAESIRLARLLCSHATTAQPSVFALLSLMLLHASRLEARTDEAGDLLLLDEQDRTKWDRALIAEGMRALDRSASGPELTKYHVQAAIAAAHAAAPSPDETDWRRVLALYDDLMDIAPSGVVALNRAVAVARVHGAAAAIAELEPLRDDAALQRYFPYAAVMGGLWRELGRSEEAADWYRRALLLAANAAERRFVEKRLAQCDGSADAVL